VEDSSFCTVLCWGAERCAMIAHVLMQPQLITQEATSSHKWATTLVMLMHVMTFS
jgi:hypothetical protein